MHRLKKNFPTAPGGTNKLGLLSPLTGHLGLPDYKPLFYKGKIGKERGAFQPEKLPVNGADPVVRVFERLIPRPAPEGKSSSSGGFTPLAGYLFLRGRRGGRAR